MDRRELADFLRNRRARLRPGDVGLAAGPRRRTPGLRRGEVALLAGISVEYYIRLEQARAPWPSRQVLGALSRALRLSDDEHVYLCDVAGQVPHQTGPRQDVPEGILHLLDRLDDAPAVVLDAKQEVLAWNPMAAALITDFSALPPQHRNLFRGLFLNRRSGTRLHPDELRQFTRMAVADLRAAAARYPQDPAIRNLIADLSASRDFTELWACHDVGVQRGFTKHIHHPIVGPLELDCETLIIPDRDQRLLIYTAPSGSPSTRALRLLKVIGRQRLDGGRSRDCGRATVSRVADR
jgi:transcriptional regulator with XRE-family HTH domain